MIALFLWSALSAAAQHRDIPMRDQAFSRERLTQQSSLQLANASAFQMQQSYSLQFTSSSLGSHSSGLYLNTLSYQFSAPLKLSVDIGMYNLFYSQMAASSSFSNTTPTSFSDTKPELVIPRIALDYQPSEHTRLSLQLLHLPDAYRAYGPSLYSPHTRNWSNSHW